MDIDAFWKLIDAGRAASDDADGLAAWLIDTLAEMPQQKIESFNRVFRERFVAAYSWDLWGVAYLANGGCSDDGFDYFRGWLIAQGRERFEAALADADAIAEFADPELTECEDMLYVAARAYKQRTGESSLPESGIRSPDEPAGQPWDEDDLERRFPRTARRFAG